MSTPVEIKTHWVDEAWGRAGAVSGFLAQGHLSTVERAAFGLEAIAEVLRADADRHACEEPELLSQRMRSGLIDAVKVIAESIASELSTVRDTAAAINSRQPLDAD